MKNKHVYLIMAHKRKDLLDLLFEELDDPRNDIVMHIDSRCHEFSYDDFHFKYSNFYPIRQIEINWGGYSQVKCELSLLKQAIKHGPYSYYHFMQGSSFPLKNQDELHDFYEKNQGKEFISIDNPILEERVKQLFLFNECGRKNDLISRIKTKISFVLIGLQKHIGYDHFKQFNMEYKKGFSLWSITEDLVKYILENESLIHKMLRYSTSGDEIMVQTIAYNSRFKNNINFIDDKHASSLWASTWYLEEELSKVRKNNNFELEDVDYLLNCKANFARKFENEDGTKIINEIKRRIHSK